MRDSRLAWSRENPRSLAAVSVAPFLRYTGHQRRRLPDSERKSVGRPGVSPPASLRAAICDHHQHGPCYQPGRGRSRPAQAGFDRALELVAGEGRRQERKGQDLRPAAVELTDLLRDLGPPGQQEGHRSPGVEGYLETLSQLRVDGIPVPAGEARDHRQVGRAGDGQQLGRPLDETQDDCALDVSRSRIQNGDPIPD